MLPTSAMTLRLLPPPRKSEPVGSDPLGFHNYLSAHTPQTVHNHDQVLWWYFARKDLQINHKLCGTTITLKEHWGYWRKVDGR